MTIQAYTTADGRINKIKGEILAHAVPVEVLGITGQQKRQPKNNGKVVVFRRWLPYGATTASPNQWNSVTANGHVTQEGVTPPADTLTPQDVSATLVQYSVLYAITDVTADLYEDDVGSEMKRHTGERLGLVRELVRYGALQACTNKFYAGGTSRATVAAKISINMLRKVTRSLEANHAKRITSILAPSPNYSTSPVEAGYIIFVHTDGESDIRDLPKFTPVSEYGSRKTIHERELGSCENYRFVTSPELRSIADSGAAIGATGLYSTTGANIDVYPFIVMAEDAYGQVALRGSDSIDVSYIPPGQKDKNDPLGQRGYIGAKYYHTAIVLNNGWMAVVEAGVTNL